jgi:hypothetical protein
MHKPITTRQHAMLDFATVGALLTLPAAMGWSKSLCSLLGGMGLVKLSYSLFTKHELSVNPIIPMETHLKLDAVAGAATVLAPMITGDKDARVMCSILGMLDLSAAPMTQTHMDGERAGRKPWKLEQRREREAQPREKNLKGGLDHTDSGALIPETLTRRPQGIEPLV